MLPFVQIRYILAGEVCIPINLQQDTGFLSNLFKRCAVQLEQPFLSISTRIDHQGAVNIFTAVIIPSRAKPKQKAKKRVNRRDGANNLASVFPNSIN